MANSAKRARGRKLAQETQRREGSRSAHQMDPVDLSLSRPETDEDDVEDREILFVPRIQRDEESPPVLNTVQAAPDCEIINMVKTLNGAIASVSQDTERIRRAYDQLRVDNIARDKALADLSAMMKEYGSPPASMRPHPVIRTDVMDGDGNLREADIGITWAGNETFLHGVRVVGPGPPRPAGIGPAMSTPYQPAKRPRHGEYVYDSTTADAFDATNSPGCGDSVTPSTTGGTSGVSTGRPHSALQQQIPELAGVV